LYQPPLAAQPLKVLSWNVQLLPRSFSLFSKALRKKQAVRTPWIIEHCQQADYDIIVFQEVFDQPLSKQLKAALLDRYPYQVDPLKQAGRLTSSGILIVSKWPIQKVGAVVYPKGAHEDAWAAKGCTVVKLQQKEKEVYIAGTHLQAGRSNAAKSQRAIQYQAIKTLLDTVTNDSLPIVLAGDLNTRKSETALYSKMLKILNMQDQPLDEERPYTIDRNNTWNKKGGSNQQLDYILLRPQQSKLQLQQQKLLRLQNKWKEQPMDLADHYGVIATFEWGAVPSKK
jgi:endonuclease/exonuclease/phosphatase family metal-dependent hydrolase